MFYKVTNSYYVWDVTSDNPVPIFRVFCCLHLRLVPRLTVRTRAFPHTYLAGAAHNHLNHSG